MCGIVAVVRRPSDRTPPSLAELATELMLATGHLEQPVADGHLAGALDDAARHVEAVDAALRGVPGIRALIDDPAGVATLATELERQQALLGAVEAALDVDGAIDADELERVNAALVRAKDAVWAVARDRLRAAREVEALAAGTDASAALEAFASVQVALSAIDRLEVRGRDSAGLHLYVRDHGLDFGAADVAAMLRERSADPLFRSGAVRVTDGALSFVYKAAAEIGELGDNVALLRRIITDDALLHRAVDNTTAHVVVLGHTRWASVGIISEANAHPLNQEERGAGDGDAYVTAALNGDVDNYAELVAAHDLSIAPEITTDAKVIPALVRHRIDAGEDVIEAFRATVAGFEGSVAIGAHAGAAPDSVLLALRGSGQALYVGVTDDCFVAASEPYGLVEETPRYLRLDGETPGNPDNPGASRGQIVVLDAAHAGSVDGLRRISYDGTVLPVSADELVTPQITTRDIDRGDFPHYLLKEISEAPGSFRKTLRGKITERDGRPTVELPHETLSEELRADLRAGRFRRVLVIGQGTAAVAGQSLVAALQRSLGPSTPVAVEAVLATELSGFRLGADMSDTLVVAISQSGTTTDTNRTVDLARSRGAAVLAIVNRRNSDLTDRADGVLYTSDGRDVEMSVASTKAFYAQVAAGFLLAFAIADELTGEQSEDRVTMLHALRELPVAMEQVLARRGPIGEVAHRLAPARRYWAVVGNGSNRIAAHEVRIKLSELCYKSIACDGTEDKKHIDLSAEPMIIVCGAGLSGSNADDVAKELAIYRAHKAAAVAVVDEGDDRFGAALDVIEVPPVHPALAFVLSAMAGHLFGYEAALAIDGSARPLREARRRHRGGRHGTPGPGAGRVGPVVGAARGAGGPFLRPAPRRPVRRHARGRHRGEARLAVPLRHAGPAARSVPGGVRQGRHAGHRHRGPHRRAHHCDRRAHPPGRRDQAPGEDGHRRDLPLGRDAAAGAARPAGARGRRGARRAQLPDVAHARRSRRRGGAGHGLHPVPDRGRPVHRGRDDRGRGPGRQRRAAALAHRRQPDAARHEAARRGRARGVGHEGPQRRPHGDHRAGGEGRADRRPHAAAGGPEDRACRRTWPTRSCPGTATATRRCVVRSPRPS